MPRVTHFPNLSGLSQSIICVRCHKPLNHAITRVHIEVLVVFPERIGGAEGYAEDGGVARMTIYPCRFKYAYTYRKSVSS